MKTMYLIKYCLAGGIEESEVASVNDEESGSWARLKGRPYASYKVGRDVFDSLEEAKAEAYKMAVKKIDSMNKQIKKLEKLRDQFKPENQQ